MASQTLRYAASPPACPMSAPDVPDARADAAGVDAAYREIQSTKGHDAFLVEWDQLTALLEEALAD